MNGSQTTYSINHMMTTHSNQFKHIEKFFFLRIQVYLKESWTGYQCGLRKNQCPGSWGFRSEFVSSLSEKLNVSWFPLPSAHLLLSVPPAVSASEYSWPANCSNDFTLRPQSRLMES